MKNKCMVTQVGWDTHRKFSTMTGRDAAGQIVWRKRVEHVDRTALQEEVRKWPKGTPVVLEGTFGWGWLSDELMAAGLDPHLASSRKVAAWRDARGLAKSNRVDADLLSELWQERGRWWEVWLAPPPVRDQRELLRYRMALVGIQSGLKNRTHAVLHRYGIIHEFSDLFGGQGRGFLGELVSSADGRLRESGRATLKGYLQLLDHIRRQIAQVTREIRRQVARTPAGERLRKIPGICWILAYTILAEIGRIERFGSYRRLASYSLLAPRADDSGEPEEGPPIGRRVGHMGRRTLKWAFIEAAHSAINCSPRLRAIFDRRTSEGKHDRNRGFIAVGHELCRIVYVVWKKGVDYTEGPPPRPGSRSVAESVEVSSGNGPARSGYGRCRRRRRLQASQ